MDDSKEAEKPGEGMDAAAVEGQSRGKKREYKKKDASHLAASTAPTLSLLQNTDTDQNIKTEKPSESVFKDQTWKRRPTGVSVGPPARHRFVFFLFCF